jgi:chloramphenicol O-acetyltransferase type A
MQNFERRRDRFEFFDRMQSPAVNLCFTMDVPDFRPWCKAQGLAPFHVMLFAVLRAVLKVENFRYRVHEGEVIRIERLVPSFTVKNQHGDLNFAQFDWSDDVREFVARGKAARGSGGHDRAEPEVPHHVAARRQGPGVRDLHALARFHLDPASDDVAGHAGHSFAGLGTFRDGPDGGLQLPFSVQAHHGFVDGYHIHLLAQQVAQELAEIIAYFSAE